MYAQLSRRTVFGPRLGASWIGAHKGHIKPWNIDEEAAPWQSPDLVRYILASHRVPGLPVASKHFGDQGLAPVLSQLICIKVPGIWRGSLGKPYSD